MKALVNGKIVLKDRVAEHQALLFDEKIIGIVPACEVSNADEIIDAGGRYICPGLIDVHIHGYLGEDASDGKIEGVRKIAEGLVKNGVTSFLPTTMTVPFDEIDQALNVTRTLMAESKTDAWRGAEILGAHAEGPFINKNKKGAQAESAILAPDADKILPYKDVVRLITMAPEVAGGIQFIEKLTKESDIHVSVGHTDATYEQTLAAFNAGADHVTHTFNAMTGLTHRAPGVVGAALNENVYTELIADTFHVSKALFSMMYKLKGDKLVLITDCVRAGGMPDGEYTLGGQPIFLTGIECRLKDGTIAGSVLKLNNAVRNFRDHAGISMREAIRCASLNPAMSIGAADRKGSIEAGKDADIVLMDEDCAVSMTILRGKTVFSD